MADLNTNYGGLKLKNPVIVGASTLASNADNLKRIEEAGASAIVYKSLFEEQIQLEKLDFDEGMREYEERNAEMIHLFPDIEHAGPQEHLMNLRKAKESIGIPLIASLNCIFSETWAEYARLIQETGVDALELNFFSVPRDPKLEDKTILNNQLETIRLIRKTVKIPVTVKLSPFYANPLHVISSMDKEGLQGVVLFNRFLQPDIDVDYEVFSNHFFPSTPEENLLPLRYAGLLYGTIDTPICCNSGIYDGKDVVKMILAGASAVQIVSALYKNKISHLGSVIKELNDWMDSKNYHSLGDFRGKLSNQNIKDPFVYKRAQYIDILSKTTEIFRKYPLH